MKLERNPKTRKVYQRFLRLVDKAKGSAFPSMKRVKQISVSHCGPAVLEALFSFVGFKISQTAVVKSLRAKNKIKNIGLSVKDLAGAVRALGKGEYVFWRKTNASVSLLETIIEKYKYPIGIEWQGVFYEFEDEDNGHYSIITSINSKTNILRIADSFDEFAGIDRKFPIKFFVKRWWDSNVIKGRTLVDRRVAFVIVPKGETWPKEIGMRRS